MSGNMPRSVQEPDINWTLPLSQARFVISILMKQPYEQVNGLVRLLEEQGNVQVRQFEQQMRGNGEDGPQRSLSS